MSEPTPPKTKQRRGFAVMDKTRVKEIAKMGGDAAQAMGVAHRWNEQTGKEAAAKSVENRKKAKE